MKPVTEVNKTGSRQEITQQDDSAVAEELNNF